MNVTFHTPLYSAHILPFSLPAYPYRSEHTLPVTSILIGQGEASAIVVTSSLDRTVKVHRMADGGRLLATASLPSGINCVALDAGEHAVYAGGSDGAVYEISLVGSGPNQPAAAAVSTSSSPAAVASLGYMRMEGHSRAVNALAMSLDGETMVSGSDDGTACVWDLRSRQVRGRPSSFAAIPPLSSIYRWDPPFFLSTDRQAPSIGHRSSPLPLRCRQYML